MTFPADLLKTMETITPLNRYFISPDYDKALALLGEHLDFRILEFDPAQSVNRWTIPPGWELKEATIKKDGKLLYDAGDHALKIIALSLPFEGVVSRDELRGHLHFDRRDPDWIPFHFRQLYRPWDRTWGFCAPQKFRDSLAEGDYEVCIRTREYAAPMKIADYTLPGEKPETVALVAHLDHPGMANDDLAGVIAGVRVMQLLSEKPRKYSYRLVLLQEIIGSEFYLQAMQEKGESAFFIYGLFLEMLGTETPLNLQRSCAGKSAVDNALESVLADSGETYAAGNFREVICNDEANWEARGVPMPSLSRYPYPQYHSRHDNMGIIAPEKLEESARLVVHAFERLENDRRLAKNFSGAPCLSHPDYDLYVDPGQAAFAKKPSGEVRKLRKLMDLIPIILSKPMTESEIAAVVDLPAASVRAYLDRWIEKDLLKVL